MTDIVLNHGLAGDTLNGTNQGLTRVEGPAVWLPTSGINRVIFPAEAEYDISGPLSLVLKGKFPSKPFHAIVSKWGSTNETKSWGLYRSTNSWQWYLNNGTGDNPIVIGNVDESLFTGEESRWLGVTAVPDNGSDEREVSLWEGGVGKTPIWSRLLTTTEAPAFPVQVTPTQSIRLLPGQVVEHFSLYEGVGDDSAPGLGTLVLSMDETVLNDFEPGLTTWPLNIGGDMVLERSSEGPVTTIIPARKTALINPDNLDVNIRLFIPSSTNFNIAANEDWVIGFVGTIGNPSSLGNGFIMVPSSAEGASLVLQASGNVFAGCVMNGSITSLDVGYPAIPENEPFVLFGFGSRSTNLNSMRLFTKDAEISGVVGIDSITGRFATNTNPYHVLRQAPGAMRAAMFRKGVGIASEYTDEVLSELAQYLLENV